MINKTVRELLGNIKDDEIQRLDELRRHTTNNNDNYDNINFNFDHGDHNDNDDDMVLMVCCINMTTSQGAQYQSQGHKNMKMSYCIDTIG